MAHRAKKSKSTGQVSARPLDGARDGDSMQDSFDRSSGERQRKSRSKSTHRVMDRTRPYERNTSRPSSHRGPGAEPISSMPADLN
eukprot:10039925-Karenia_brevis.AAC.1